MTLNVIDFNDYLKKSYRNRFCTYRNLELGHEIHVYNENSKLIQACQSTIEPDIKKILNKVFYSKQQVNLYMAQPYNFYL